MLDSKIHGLRSLMLLFLFACSQCSDNHGILYVFLRCLVYRMLMFNPQELYVACFLVYRIQCDTAYAMRSSSESHRGVVCQLIYPTVSSRMLLFPPKVTTYDIQLQAVSYYRNTYSQLPVLYLWMFCINKEIVFSSYQVVIFHIK